ncbi:MAG: hypothetical protein JWN64_847 [Parcubacteria group bacterium]|nr:hypothetical protein [Parcubacteria group bacterium]
METQNTSPLSTKVPSHKDQIITSVAAIITISLFYPAVKSMGNYDPNGFVLGGMVFAFLVTIYFYRRLSKSHVKGTKGSLGYQLARALGIIAMVTGALLFGPYFLSVIVFILPVILTGAYFK